ncbi:MAG: rRNA maturation RNase YbeY [Cyanobacteria bacterium TGS_CYA1]|nr:rRNA maturation RNase YbeY [Cyanobacteria bacterium TGS_CYA1]
MLLSHRVQVVNSQRRHSVNKDQVSEMADKIVLGVLSNLEEKPCAWLNKKTLKDIEKHGFFSLALVSDAKIRILNKMWREKDYATDVLSFPIELSYDPNQSPDSEWIVGEIIISMDKCLEQARNYGHSQERELAFLIAHSVLHILGFDHETKQEEKDMFSRQKAVLDRLGYKR